MYKMQLVKEGQRFLAANMSPIPVKGKMPWMSPRYNGEVTWDKYKETPIDEPTLIRLIHDRRTTGICVACGAVSQNLEILDFDFKLGVCQWEDWKALVGTAWQGLPWVRTGGGGFQLAYRCELVEPRKILSYIPDPAPKNPRFPWKGVIETRGKDNLAVVPPSIHPDTRAAYVYGDGHFADAPMITIELRALFHTACAALNAKPADKPKQPQAEKRVWGGFKAYERQSVIAAFNQSERIEYWLEQLNYTVDGDFAIKPDGERKTVKIRNNMSFHNGTGDPLCDRHWKTPFELMRYKLFDHLAEKESVRAALEHASIVTGIPIMTYALPPQPPPPPQPYPIPPPPPPIVDYPERPDPDPTPIPSPPTAEYDLVVITDDSESAALLQRMGMPVIVSHRLGSDLAVVSEQVDLYRQAVVILGPPDDGMGEALAADLGAAVASFPVRLIDLFADGATSVIDFVAALRRATRPAYRILGKKEQ